MIYIRRILRVLCLLLLGLSFTGADVFSASRVSVEQARCDAKDVCISVSFDCEYHSRCLGLFASGCFWLFIDLNDSVSVVIDRVVETICEKTGVTADSLKNLSLGIYYGFDLGEHNILEYTPDASFVDLCKKCGMGVAKGLLVRRENEGALAFFKFEFSPKHLSHGR